MTTIADYRAEVLRFETIIKGKDAALSGMKAENVKLSQEIENLKKLAKDNWELSNESLMAQGKNIADLREKIKDLTEKLKKRDQEIAELKAEIMSLRFDPAKKAKETKRQENDV
jgi:predicted RNase H-like nuclease (RuvC/YqgF family)